MKLSEYDTDISTSKTHISNFYFCDLRSSHFRDHYKSMGNKINPLFYALAGVYLNGIATCRAFTDTSSTFFLS